jgi:hypothetical protein
MHPSSPMSRDERAFLLDWVARIYGLHGAQAEAKLEEVQAEEVARASSRARRS